MGQAGSRGHRHSMDWVSYKDGGCQENCPRLKGLGDAGVSTFSPERILRRLTCLKKFPLGERSPGLWDTEGPTEEQCRPVSAKAGQPPWGGPAQLRGPSHGARSPEDGRVVEKRQKCGLVSPGTPVLPSGHSQALIARGHLP